MEFVIVTGLSGAGKSSVMRFLEDIGFFCIDNMPPQMIPKFGEICANDCDVKKVAIATDIRGGTMLLNLNDAIEELNKNQISTKIIFLTARKEVLVKRFKETRRKHPLDEQVKGDLYKAVDAEIEALSDIKGKAHFVIDTSSTTTSKLKSIIASMFLSKKSDSIIINIYSFGFKYNPPEESDLVFDVRCLPNPFYVPELKGKTGLDSSVSEYVMSFNQAKELEQKLFNLFEFLLPLYISEGKTQLVIAFGCTGGKHRSVTFAESTANFLEQKGYNVRVSHRDINRH